MRYVQIVQEYQTSNFITMMNNSAGIEAVFLTLDAMADIPDNHFTVIMAITGKEPEPPCSSMLLGLIKLDALKDMVYMTNAEHQLVMSYNAWCALGSPELVQFGALDEKIMEISHPISHGVMEAAAIPNVDPDLANHPSPAREVLSEQAQVMVNKAQDALSKLPVPEQKLIRNAAQEWTIALQRMDINVDPNAIDIVFGPEDKELN